MSGTLFPDLRQDVVDFPTGEISVASEEVEEVLSAHERLFFALAEIRDLATGRAGSEFRALSPEDLIARIAHVAGAALDADSRERKERREARAE